ncbi:uncharacterized protein LOC129727047 [Wyeomyia smithii]|uniref:uncharacterized protein LOC129727047 n=1 Tax=Wyeomyia smithii TaxID=174621 RepID=UPI002467FFBF|nr:uncharacterized protein LOC129727047 [Wyeomyia smithii]
MMFNMILLAVVTLLLNGGGISQWMPLAEANSCRKLDACRCEYPDGSGYDLSELLDIRDNYMMTQDAATQDWYYFHPCSDIKYLNSTEAPCSQGKGYTLCRRHTVNSTDTFQKLGTTETSSFSSDADNNQEYLVYKTADSEVTTIQLVCVKNTKSYIFVEQDTVLKTAKQVNILLFSPYACITTIEEISQSSVGQVLLILFFTGTFAYFTIASIVRFMYFGARGIEVIPNLQFWQDLPGLVRDGANFIRNGCRVEPSPDPDSYDAI